MRQALGVLLAVATLAAVAGRLFRASSGEVRPEGEAGAQGVDAAPGEARVRPLLSALRGGPAARRSAAAAPVLPPAFAPERRPGGLYVHGIVVDERGVPVSGAEVETAWMDENGNPGGEVAHRTATDSTGHYLLPCPEPRPFHAGTVRARGEGRASATYTTSPCRFQRLEVRPTVTVTGRVVDRDTGRAIAGASVLEWAGDWASESGLGVRWSGLSSAQTSSPDGRFTLVAPREGLRVSAWHEGYRYVRVSLDPDDVGRADLTLRLAPAEKRTVRRRLVHQGRPVSGALVRLVNLSFGVEREPLASVRTDGDGRVEFETVAHRDYALESSVGRLRAFDVVRGNGFDDGDMDLLAPLAVTGTVTRGGKPEAGATVEMRRDAPREILTARTDGLGRYRFEEVRRPRHRMEVVVHVREAGGASRWARADVTHSQTDDVVVPAIEMAPSRWKGHVRDPEGRPLARAVVRNANPWGVATTDAEGAFEIAGAAGGCRLTASAPGYVTQEVEVWAVEDKSACDVVLRRGGSLHGRVSDEQGRAVEATVTVLGDVPGRPEARVWNGSWSVDGLVGSAFGVRIEAPGYEPVELTDLPPDSVAPPVVLRRK